jgi:hypothetical protein
MVVDGNVAKRSIEDRYFPRQRQGLESNPLTRRNCRLGSLTGVDAGQPGLESRLGLKLIGPHGAKVDDGGIAPLSVCGVRKSRVV